MSGVVFLLFVLFLHCWLCVEPYPLLRMEGSNDEFSSSALDNDLPKMFDEILLEVPPNYPYDALKLKDGVDTASRQITRTDDNENHLLPNSLKNSEVVSSSNSPEEHLAKIFDEILLQVSPNDPYDALKDGVDTGSRQITRRDVNENHLPPNSLKNSEVVSSSNSPEEHLAKIFDEILLQVFPKDTYDALKDGASTAGRLITGRDINERFRAAWNSPEPELFLGTMGKTPDNDHISEEEQDKKSSLFNRDVNEQLTTVSPEAVNTDVHFRNLHCGQMLHFLRKNIIAAAVAAAAIVAATVLLVLLLATYIRRKQPLYAPANMTYNIFIMSGKSWWQKSQEKTLRKFTGKQKQLKFASCV